MRSIKNECKGVSFRSKACKRGTTNIMSTVDRWGLSRHSSPGRNFLRPQYVGGSQSLRRPASICPVRSGEHSLNLTHSSNSCKKEPDGGRLLEPSEKSRKETSLSPFAHKSRTSPRFHFYWLLAFLGVWLRFLLLCSPPGSPVNTSKFVNIAAIRLPQQSRDVPIMLRAQCTCLDCLV